MGRTASKKTAAKKDSDWFRKDDDVRWAFGVPPKGNANFAWVQHFIHHLAPQTALRDSALLQREASPQVVSEAKDNMAGRCEVGTTNFEFQSSRVFHSTFGIQHSSFAPSSNQSGDCPVRSATKMPKAKPQSLPRQRDIRRALIEADREMPSDELRTPNRVSLTSTFEIQHSSFASLPGQLFYSTQIPICLWFLAKNKAAGKCRAVSDLELALAA